MCKVQRAMERCVSALSMDPPETGYLLCTGYVFVALSYVVYPGLTFFSGILFWVDCLTESALFLPGDSAMAFVVFSELGGLFWLVVWLSTSWVLVWSLDELRIEHVLVASLTVGLVCFGAQRVLTLTPAMLERCWDTTLAKRLLFCALPGLRGSLSGIAIASHRPWFRRRVVGSLAVALGTLFGATFLWWPKELVTIIGCLMSARGYPEGWSRLALLKQLALASTLAALTVLFFLASVHAWRADRQLGRTVAAKSGDTTVISC